jgi:GTP-binding protein Era
MSSVMQFKSGFVTIVGRPNAGKSTLVNRLVGHKVAIVSTKPQTTRNRIQGMMNRKGAQIVLLDTPGLHKPETVLGRQMLEEITRALDGIDVLALLVDATQEFGTGDRYALERVERFGGKRFLVLNKIDLIDKRVLLPLIEKYSKECEFAEILPISALKGTGVGLLADLLIKHLPEGAPYFPADQFTDQPERFLAAEIVREKILAATYEEVPHGIAVVVDEFEEGPRLVRIRAEIYVEREGQKGIVIGRGGEMLKKVGTAARKEMEELFGVKVFLELQVKVHPNWRNDPAVVRQLDWRRQLEGLSGD